MADRRFGRLALLLGSCLWLGLINSQHAIAQPAPVGRCLHLDSTQFLEGRSPYIPVAGSFSLSLWVNLSDNYLGYSEFISQGAQPYAFYLGVTPDLTIRAGDAWQDTGVELRANVWTHLVLVRNSSGDAVLYVNGIKRATKSDYKVDSTGWNTRIGAQFGDWVGERFEGCIDDLAIYSRALTDQEVQSSFLNSDSPRNDGLLGYFGFDNDFLEANVVSSQGSTPVNFLASSSIELPYSAHPSLGIVRRYGNGAISMNRPGEGLAQNYYVTSDFLQPIPEEYGNGFSWYASSWPMVQEQVENLQIGLGSTWIVPNNEKQSEATAQSVCGIGADPFIKSQATNPRNGKYGLSLFQTIEGSLGWWGGQIFKTHFAKYSVNVTQNCYQSDAATPGWGFFRGANPLPIESTGFVQLSNTLLMPPDGVTFRPEFNIEQLGISWLALPFPKVGFSGQSGGNQAWTLFLRGKNHEGAIGYVLPQFWAAGSQLNPIQKGLTLDQRPGYVGAMAAEWNTIPYMEFVESDGTTYSKIPPLSFFADSNGNTALNRDISGYSASFVANQFAKYVSGETAFPKNVDPRGTFTPGVRGNAAPLYQNGALLSDITSLLSSRTMESNRAYGFSWTKSDEEIKLAQYYKQVGTQRIAISEADAPKPLQRAQFAKSTSDKSFTYDSPSWWLDGVSTSAEQSVDLVDGTTITYRWFRFSDQPALRRLGLTATEKARLQNLAEDLQRQWNNSSPQAAASSGELLSFDTNILLSPPNQYSVGYVPIVVRQQRSNSALKYQTAAYTQAKLDATSRISAAEKAAAEKAAAEKAAADKAAAEKAAAEKAAADKAAADKAAAEKAAAEKASAAKKKTITCVKGKTTKRVTAVNPKCPSGYKKRA